MRPYFLAVLLPLTMLSAHAKNTINFNGTYLNDANIMEIKGKKLSLSEGNACEHSGILTPTKSKTILAYKNKQNQGVIDYCYETSKSYKIQATKIDPKTQQVLELKIINGGYMNGVYTRR